MSKALRIVRAVAWILISVGIAAMLGTAAHGCSRFHVEEKREAANIFVAIGVLTILTAVIAYIVDWRLRRAIAARGREKKVG